MLYLDTSILVSALTNEADTAAVQAWLAGQVARDLTISDWVVTEFSSAMSIKLRSGQLDNSAPTIARRRWRRLRDWPRRHCGFCRWSERRFERRHGSPISRHLICAPATPCIWRYVPNGVPRFAHSIGGWARPLR
jgi:hypothetical protein